MTPGKQNLYCYVDETGQDSDGQFFVVSVVIGDSRKDEMIAALEAIERRSGKGNVKWMKVRIRQRLAYISEVLRSPLFRGSLYFSLYTGTKSYMATTVMTTAQAILRAGQSATPAVVYVDGLPKSRLRWFGVELRHLSIRTNKVVGVRREEADALIRLADACCGFVRAALLARQPDMAELYEKAKASGHLTQL